MEVVPIASSILPAMTKSARPFNDEASDLSSSVKLIHGRDWLSVPMFCVPTALVFNECDLSSAIPLLWVPAPLGLLQPTGTFIDEMACCMLPLLSVARVPSGYAVVVV